MAEPISPNDTQRLLDSDRRVAVIDVREPLEYSRGHVTQSTLIPRRLLEFRIPEVVPNADTTVILCDQRGERAESDANWLAELGYADVSYLDGGFAAWEDAGFDIVEAQDDVYSTAFNFPSKDFGERVQIEERVEQIQPDELKALLDTEDESIVVADVRTPKEHREMTIPGALNVEGVDLGLYADQLREGDETLVVHCAGRTRSIIGAASLEKLGFENVYELENGTMGWELAGYELERGGDRHVRKLDVEDATRDEIRSKAESLLEESDASTISLGAFRDLIAGDGEDGGGDEIVYPVDVRTEAEYEEGHLPGTLSIPGGQAIQTADEHFAVRQGTIVFISNEHVRSAITAYWFSEMGFPNVAVLEGGLDGWRDAGRSLETGRDRTPPLNRTEIEDRVTYVSASELADSIDSGRTRIVDIDTSASFERGHVPGARWVPRYDLETWLDENDGGAGDPLVLTCRNGLFPTYGAAAIQRKLGYENVRVLEGGTEAWAAHDRQLDEGTDGMEREPRDALPPVTQQGDQAKRAYLEWEEELGDKYVSETRD